MEIAIKADSTAPNLDGIAIKKNPNN